jgi:hypothetical protein
MLSFFTSYKINLPFQPSLVFVLVNSNTFIVFFVCSISPLFIIIYPLILRLSVNVWTSIQPVRLNILCDQNIFLILRVVFLLITILYFYFISTTIFVIITLFPLPKIFRFLHQYIFLFTFLFCFPIFFCD